MNVLLLINNADKRITKLLTLDRIFPNKWSGVGFLNCCIDLLTYVQPDISGIDFERGGSNN